MSSGTTWVLPKAREDLEEIAAYIGADNLDAALRVIDAIEVAFGKLAVNPELGVELKELSKSSLQNLRMWVVPRFRNYLIFYRPTANGVEVVRVLHGARDLRNLLEQ